MSGLSGDRSGKLEGHRTVSLCLIPQLSLPILYSSLHLSLHSGKMDPPPHPQGPLITDRATCKDRSDLLPSQLLRGENLSVWPSPSQVSSVSGPVTSGPVTSGQGTAWWGAGDHRTGAASREGGSWRPPSGADPSEGLHPQLPVQRSHEPGLAFWQISSGSRSWRVSDREGWTQSLTTKLSMVNPLKETRTE